MFETLMLNFFSISCKDVTIDDSMPYTKEEAQELVNVDGYYEKLLEKGP